MGTFITTQPLSERPVMDPQELPDRWAEGAIGFAKWFSRTMDENGWSHPQMVVLTKQCTGGKALLHSSQIAGLRQAKLKSPGPRSFLALEYLWRAVYAFNHGGDYLFMPFWGPLEDLVKDREVMLDPTGLPATTGYMIEVFVGMRPVPIDISKTYYTEAQAEKVSVQAGVLLRRLIALAGMDVVTQSADLAHKFGGSPETKARFRSLLVGMDQWAPEELDEQLVRLTNLLRDEFDHKRTPAELRDELLAAG